MSHYIRSATWIFLNLRIVLLTLVLGLTWALAVQSWSSTLHNEQGSNVKFSWLVSLIEPITEVKSDWHKLSKAFCWWKHDKINLGLYYFLMPINVCCQLYILLHSWGRADTNTVPYSAPGCCSHSIMTPDRNEICEKEIIQINKHIHFTSATRGQTQSAVIVI